MVALANRTKAVAVVANQNIAAEIVTYITYTLCKNS